ncbi:MAG: pyridoxal-phosphate dependent enzyme [Thermoleophilaceae bacterium]
MPSFELQANPWRRPFAGGRGSAAPAFHRALAGYAPTDLRDEPELAAALGVGRVWLKFERERFGLPAFKFLGASWAAEQLLGGRDAAGVTLVTATDGNHGRAVARVARMRGLAAHILVPAGTAQARIDAIAGEGADVEVVDGSYDDAVRRAAAMAADDVLVLSDTSWPGYEQVPRWVVEGYETIFTEADEQLGGARPDVALIPIGVGSLAAAAAAHWPESPPLLVGVEPSSAACAFASIRAGAPVEVPGPHHSIMAGLNAGSVSLQAWPVLRDRYDAFCTIDDGWAEQGIRRLAAIGVEAGEVSGGVLGAAGALCADAAGRKLLEIGREASVLLLLTEGVTDPVTWQRIVSG